MNLIGITKRTIKKATGYKGKGVVILMYHRVVDVSSSAYHIVTSPDHFHQHMEHIQLNCRPMRLMDVVSALDENSLPPKGVVVTFDDGYIDNFNFAYPILEKFKIPATIFVTSGYIERNREYWWDELERIFFIPEKLPEKLETSVNGVEIDLQLPTTSQEQRKLTHKAMHAFLRNLRSEDRDNLLSSLATWAGMGDNGRQEYRSMNSDEIVKLSKSSLIEIGAHTITHPVLSTLSAEEQYDEIVGSQKKLESMLGRSVNTFAYPYGSAGDFTSQTLEIARQAGFKAACTTVSGTVTEGHDLMALPRRWVGDWDLTTFERQLDAFFP
jgi:peptidoglycan/xylan/chitin deacetylase (PgdA/CDA1 family)